MLTLAFVRREVIGLLFYHETWCNFSTNVHYLLSFQLLNLSGSSEMVTEFVVRRNVYVEPLSNIVVFFTASHILFNVNRTTVVCVSIVFDFSNIN